MGDEQQVAVARRVDIGRLGGAATDEGLIGDGVEVGAQGPDQALGLRGVGLAVQGRLQHDLPVHDLGLDGGRAGHAGRRSRHPRVCRGTGQSVRAVQEGEGLGGLALRDDHGQGGAGARVEVLLEDVLTADRGDIDEEDLGLLDPLGGEGGREGRTRQEDDGGLLGGEEEQHRDEDGTEPKQDGEHAAHPGGVAVRAIDSLERTADKCEQQPEHKGYGPSDDGQDSRVEARTWRHARIVPHAPTGRSRSPGGAGPPGC